METKPILELRHIDKSFPGVRALTDVSLEIYSGECHALLGENGAGKSTLIKVMAGIYDEDGGEIVMDGKRIAIPDVQHSKALGISVIHQELILVPHMTIAENIFLGQELNGKGSLFIDRETMEARAQDVLDNFNLNLSATQNVATLSVAQQQMVEIAKALSADARIIIMDEPTAALTNKETDQLFKLVEVMKGQGKAIIFVSHRMEELFILSDRVTVLRDGEYIGTKITAETDRKELIAMMVGRPLSDFYLKREHSLGKEILKVGKLNRKGLLHDISFSLREGEILGFSGIVGAGRTELARVLFGIDAHDSGEILMNGETVSIEKAEDAMALGIGFVPEDRKQQGLFLQEKVGFNLSIQVLKDCFRWIRTSNRRENDVIRKGIDSLSIKTHSPSQMVSQLSGGNQQKVVIAKWLARKPKILILDEPTRGIDVGAKTEIYRLIGDLAKSGVAIIMISSELPEILNMSDRILVMYQGKIMGEIAGEEATQEKIMHYATGGRDE